MAPVGRWQQGKDLFWYARGEDDEETKAERERNEIQRVKDAEQEAMAGALGLPVPPKSTNENANMVPLGGKDVKKSIQDTTADDDQEAEQMGRGVGYGSSSGGAGPRNAGGDDEKLEAVGLDRHHRGDRRRRDRSPGRDRRRDRSGDRNRERERRHRRHRDDRDRHHRSHRQGSRSRSREREHRRRRSYSRSRSRDRRGHDDDYRRHRHPDRSHRSYPRERASDHHRRR